MTSISALKVKCQGQLCPLLTNTLPCETASKSDREF